MWHRIQGCIKRARISRSIIQPTLFAKAFTKERDVWNRFFCPHNLPIKERGNDKSRKRKRENKKPANPDMLTQGDSKHRKSTRIYKLAPHNSPILRCHGLFGFLWTSLVDGLGRARDRRVPTEDVSVREVVFRHLARGRRARPDKSCSGCLLLRRVGGLGVSLGAASH